MNATILAWMVGPWEVAAILVVALLLFGGKKLPELAKGLGKGLRVFKKEISGVRESIEEAVEAEPDDQDDQDDMQDEDAEEKETKDEKTD